MDSCFLNTPIQQINSNLFIKREDLIPYSFGGNKVRKALLFFKQIDIEKNDCVVTYGSSSSNHCRAVSNLAAQRGIKCYIISPNEDVKQTYNSKMMELFGAEIVKVSLKQVHETIEKKLLLLKGEGHNPFFIPGGGHGNIGTRAYVQCYEEISNYEIKNNIHFDYIFHASGTGTTQAGLICGQLAHHDNRRIVGVSIARNNPIGRKIILESVKNYCIENDINVAEKEIDEVTLFIDDYIGEGYGKECKPILAEIQDVMHLYGIPLDSTYTGKAFWGMQQYIKQQQISGKNILFIHTGGTPLFFDDLKDF